MRKLLERLKLEALNAHTLVLVATLALPIVVGLSILSKMFAILLAGSIAAGGIIFYIDMQENDILKAYKYDEEEEKIDG